MLNSSNKKKMLIYVNAKRSFNTREVGICNEHDEFSACKTDVSI